MEFTMSLNLLLLVAMVATNILSLYHLSSTIQTSGKPPAPPPIPDRLLHQLNTIHTTINRLTRLQPTSNPATKAATIAATIPSDLLLYSLLSPITTSCHYHLDLLHQYMNYTTFSLCPQDSDGVAESFILRGCRQLPRRRCFSKTPPNRLIVPLRFLRRFEGMDSSPSTGCASWKDREREFLRRGNEEERKHKEGGGLRKRGNTKEGGGLRKRGNTSRKIEERDASNGAVLVNGFGAFVK